MQLKPTLLALALAAASTSAFATGNISNLTLSGGTFQMWTAGNVAELGAVTYAVNPIFSGTNLTTAYVGSGANAASATNTANSLIEMSFFSSAVNGYTAASNLGTTATPAGTIAGGPLPNGTISGSNITLDLSSFFANYNGNDFNQGTSAATGTCTFSGSNCNYTVSWQSTIVGGSFNGYVGHWTMQGVAAPVPEASTYGMMVVGLGLVGAAVMRRRKV